MGSALSGFRTLVVPAIVSLVIFLSLTFIILPFWRRYRSRYSQYLPLDTLADQTATLRHRITNRILNFALPSTWARDRRIASANGNTDDDLEFGEELNDADGETLRALESRVGESRLPDHTRRLSRELEEGFIDDSDDEDIR